MNQKNSEYWDNFYSGIELKSTRHPSQFAAFVLGEFPDADRLIEFGCGNGRDAEFFAVYGLNVIAADASQSAVDVCNKRSIHSNLKFAKFVVGVDDISKLSEYLSKPAVKTVLYARFFLHAMTDKEEEDFFALASAILESGSIMALEYRCADDAKIRKEFGEHYRRYLKHNDLCTRVVNHGFKIDYQIEGRGYAKYKAEDAFVGRCIAVRL